MKFVLNDDTKRNIRAFIRFIIRRRRFLATICFILFAFIVITVLIPRTNASNNEIYLAGNVTTVEKADNSSASRVESLTEYIDESPAAGKADLHKSAVIAIDPGHGGRDGGTYHEKILEKDLNLDISLRLGELLESAGIKVVFTRETDVYVSLEERVAIVNASGADLFICVHNNATDDGPIWNGTETLYSSSGSGEGEMDGRKLALIVQEELVAAMGTHDNDILYSPKMIMLYRTTMPAVIAEVGYITNDEDRAKLEDPEMRQKAAQALYNAIIKALDVMSAD